MTVLFISPDSLHIVDQSRGETAMIRLLSREQRDLAGDAEALAAVRRGRVPRVKHCGWHHLDHGRRLRACRAYLQGFALTGDLGLLLRALLAWMPRALQPGSDSRDREDSALARF